MNQEVEFVEDAQVEVPSVSQMLRMTGENTHTLMLQIAEHIDKLEAQVVQLTNRITELESKQ